MQFDENSCILQDSNTFNRSFAEGEFDVNCKDYLQKGCITNRLSCDMPTSLMKKPSLCHFGSNLNIRMTCRLPKALGCSRAWRARLICNRCELPWKCIFLPNFAIFWISSSENDFLISLVNESCWDQSEKCQMAFGNILTTLLTIQGLCADDDVIKNRQQLSLLLYSIDIWPARNSRLTQRETNHFMTHCASELAWPYLAGSSPGQLVIDLFVQHQRFAVCCQLGAWSTLLHT